MNKSAETLIIDCPVCHSDEGDTLGVTGEMGDSLASTVVMQCDKCETVYLSPPPLGKREMDESDLGAYAGAIRRAKQSVPVNTRFLSADENEAGLLARNDKAASLDKVLLPLTIETSNDPVSLMRHVSGLLDDGGVIDVVVGNAGSSSFGLFGGRHWYGYRFPSARLQFTERSIRVIATRAGLDVVKVSRNAAPTMWLKSLNNAFEDWGTNKVVRFLAAGPWGIPWLLAWLLEWIAVFRGKASLLYVQLRKANGADDGK